MTKKEVIKSYKIVIINMLKHKNFEFISSDMIALRFNGMEIRINLDKLYISIFYDKQYRVLIDISRYDKIYRASKRALKICKRDMLNSAWSMLKHADTVEYGNMESEFLQDKFNSYKNMNLEIRWDYGRSRISLINRDIPCTVLEIRPFIFGKISRKLRKFIRVCNYEKKCRKQQMEQESDQKLADELYTKLFEEI